MKDEKDKDLTAEEIIDKAWKEGLEKLERRRRKKDKYDDEIAIEALIDRSKKDAG